MAAPAFDPAAWLAAFTEAGGSYAITSEGRLWLGEIGQRSGALTMAFGVLGQPERVEAIKALVRERCLIA